MEKALILMGAVETPQGITESYQLLIGCSYVPMTYDRSSERDSFLEEASDTFVDRIVAERSRLEVVLCNGLRINPETGCNERILKLEERLMAQLAERLSTKIMQSGIVAIPVPFSN